VEGEIGPGTGAVEEEFDHGVSFCFVVLVYTVIASEAKQSIALPWKDELLRRFRSSQ
jgi:hypothetical protein